MFFLPPHIQDSSYASPGSNPASPVPLLARHHDKEDAAIPSPQRKPDIGLDLLFLENVTSDLLKENFLWLLYLYIFLQQNIVYLFFFA